MKLTLLGLPLLFVIQLYEIETWPEFDWIIARDLMGIELGEKIKYRNSPYSVFSMPVLEWYPEAASQLDSMVGIYMKNQYSMEWVLDSLRPDFGPASVLKDKTINQMLYYLCVNYLIRQQKPWHFDDIRPSLWYVNGGSGTPHRGWIRYAKLMLGEEPFYEGFFCISWSPTVSKDFDIEDAIDAYQDAKQAGVFVSRSIDPVWKEDFTVAECMLYNSRAFYIKTQVEFRTFFWKGCVTDTFNIFLFDYRGHKYLVGFTNWLLKSPVGSHTEPPDMSFFQSWMELYLELDSL